MTSSPPPTAQPVPPSTAHLQALQARTEALATSVLFPPSDHAGAPGDVVAAVESAVEALAEDLLALSHDLHAHPEVGFEEHRSAAAVAELLGRHGVEAQVGRYGLETALEARSGSGSPVVAVLAEYDALPGIGHACGHNVICSTAVGAFLALDRVRRDHGLPGTVVLLGTPAEEGGGGKVLMADAGAFDGVDAAVMLHGFSHDVADHPFLGRRQLDVTYTGVAAHASAQPFMGRNALDAAVLAYQGIGLLRQHLPDTDRVHGVFTDGGQRPNVVPGRAALQLYLRSAEASTLDDLATRVEAIAVGAAAMTGCGYELSWDPSPAYLPIRHNAPMAARWAHHLGRRGRRVLPRGVVPESLTGSTDLGNVSRLVPAIHPMLAIAEPGTSLHTVEFAAAAGSPSGDRGVVDGAAGLALVAADLLLDEALLADARRAFEAET